MTIPTATDRNANVNASAATDIVRAWHERVLIPTYPIGSPNKNPMFLEKRVYQGSSGVVYPHPVIDRVFDDKRDQAYDAIFLENRYLKIMLLPELGGRVQMALDKTNGYHFVYYNRVIKPALVGLTGPWISGGIEFNWPQHHRPSTFEPVDTRIQSNPDGSQTVWCSELERMFRTKGMHGFTLHPDRAYLEISVRLYNRTSEPQTFLWWANPAVHVNDDYQSIFPPDVHAVMDHGKRDVSDFPIATGTYYKVNYAPGTDISRYKNIPVPTSYMAYHSDFDFVGCYDHGARAGMMHVANHHVVPGKKQWTWGNSDFGLAWDRNLTDADGPYIELMCGAYTDNQPDFSWIQPGEEKSFTQIFMPYKEIGGASNANKHAVIKLDVNVDADPKLVQIGVYLTSPHEARVQLLRDGQVVFDRAARLSPEQALIERVALDAAAAPQALTLRVLAEDGRELIAFSPLPDQKPDIPAAATPARLPKDIASADELFLNGLHLEQYRHANYAPEPYYEEALRRDPGDYRCNNAMGLLLYRRGAFAQAEPYFRAAIARLIVRNPNPYDGEAYYNLGLTLRMQGRTREAIDAFYKAAWNAAWQDAAYFELARLASREGRAADALELIDRALVKNWRRHQARHLKIALLRRAGRTAEALAECELALSLDPMDPGALWERGLLNGDGAFEAHIRADGNILIEIALDYGHAGLYAEAIALLGKAPANDVLAKYFAGWLHASAGDEASARAAYAAAAALPADFVFPNQLECIPALQTAARLNPADAHASYALGNFWYAHRRYADAISCWEQSRAQDGAFPTVHRNLGLAYFNKLNAPARARESLEAAFALDRTDAHVFFELDQLHKKLGQTPELRLARFAKHLGLVGQRDDLSVEYAGLLNMVGRHADGLALLAARTFHPWEGGEGKVTLQYVSGLVETAREHIAAKRFEQAVDCLTRAQSYPHNLGEGKLFGAQENHLFFYLGQAYAGLGDAARSRRMFELATQGLSEPASALYYNDQPPDMIFYQGLAHQQLGRAAQAEAVFNKLLAYGMQHMDDKPAMPYFGVSLPDFMVFDDDAVLRNRVHCHYMQALGHLGLGDTARAKAAFTQVVALNPNHQGAVLHARLCDSIH